jgi:hypothetical protein
VTAHNSYDSTFKRIYRDRLVELSQGAQENDRRRAFLSALVETLQQELNANCNKSIPCVAELELLSRVQKFLIQNGDKIGIAEHQHLFGHLHNAKEGITYYSGAKMVGAKIA